jgi:peptide-methionine (S)-S-oxide reductase
MSQSLSMRGMLVLFFSAWAATVSVAQDKPSAPASSGQSQLQTATFGGGCFWCVEAVFENMEGVTDVVSGYAGGNVANPSYEQVCTGLTGHAEVCQITFDPKKVSFNKLLAVFMKTHDPTTLNAQGPDHGTQYRSVVFYHSDEQKASAEKMKQELNAAGAYNAPIVTEISPLPKFYPAEDYHQDYYRKHPNAGYCRMVVRPKVAKFKKVIEELEKQEKTGDKK